MAFPLRGTGIPVLLALTIGVVEAQPLVRPASTAASSPGTASSAVRGTTYRSAFEGYRSFDEQPLTPWRQANAAVGEIGGWRAYAREAQSNAPARGAAPQAAPSSPAGRAVAPAGGHSGHKMP